MVEEIHMRRRASLHHVDDALRLGSKMRQTRKRTEVRVRRGTRFSVRSRAVLGKQRCQGGQPNTGTRMSEELAPRLGDKLFNDRMHVATYSLFRTSSKFSSMLASAAYEACSTTSMLASRGDSPTVNNFSAAALSAEYCCFTRSRLLRSTSVSRSVGLREVSKRTRNAMRSSGELPPSLITRWPSVRAAST